MNKALQVFEIATKNSPAKVIMTVAAEFIQWPGQSGGLYRVDNGELLPSDLMVLDSHGNYRLAETINFHSAPLVNGQIVDVTL